MKSILRILIVSFPWTLLVACVEIIGIKDLPEPCGNGMQSPADCAGLDAAPPEDPGTNSPAVLWTEITGANDYKGWYPFPGHEEVAPYTGHGATYRRVFANMTAATDLASLPAGAIIVKEDLNSENPDDLAAITVMQKQGDTWYWARFMPDGRHDVAGTTEELAGTACVSAACHGDMPSSQNDFVFLNNAAQGAAPIYDEMTMAGDVYTSWVGFASDTPQVTPDTTGGLHGGPFLRIFINDVADSNPTNLADGSILAIEHLNGEDPAAPGALASIAVMKKIAGVDPENEDWLYARFGADGKVQFAGTLGQDAVYCAHGACHGSVDLTGGDFVIRN